MQTVRDGHFFWRTTSEVSYLEPVTLSRHPQLRCAFTLRRAGTSGQALNMSFERGERGEVLANRQRLLRGLGLGHTSLVAVRQVHGKQVYVVDAETARRGLSGVQADALVTVVPEVPLGVLVADCLPIVLYALRPPVLAVVHAGRWGTYHRIVHRVIKVMQRCFAVATEQLYAVFGPAIGACCYTLDAPAVRPFQERFPQWEDFFTPRDAQHWVMSLTAANEAQLLTAGVPPHNPPSYGRHLYLVSQRGSVLTSCRKGRSRTLYGHCRAPS
ncbi:hypothetical protein NKDENANG_02483 [Candidatus Entotheonellaceae bacterium PAL068K]